MRNDEDTNPKLLPVVNLRIVMPRVCATCKHGGNEGEGSFVCHRPEGPVWDIGDGFHWLRVCDRYTRAPNW